MKQVITLLLLATCTLSMAQADKATLLLQEVASKFKSYDNVIFNYKGVIKNTASDLNMDLKGEATLSGENYNVDFMGSTYVFDGNKLHVVNREDEQITISKLTEQDENMISPSNILTFYEKGYKAQWDIEQNVRGRKIQYLKLIPINSNSEYKQVLLGIDINTKHIYNAIITENTGTIANFTLLSLKTNQPLPQNHFTVDTNDYDNWYIEQLN